MVEPGSQVFASRHHGLLGTVVEVTSRVDEESVAIATERVVVSKIARLQRVFDRFDSESNLCRWQRGLDTMAPELETVLSIASEWHGATNGVFDPTVGRLYELWSRVASEGRVPTEAELENVRPSASLTLDLSDPEVAAAVDLNAVAKGWIVDRAMEAGIASVQPGAALELVVNAGGDLVHHGAGSVGVGIENPLRPFDNESPIAHVAVANAAIATSGGARRFWEVDGRRYSRVLDPRSGRPTEGLASASVVAENAETADVLATAITVLGEGEGIKLADRLQIAACCVTHEGEIVVNQRWRSIATM